MTSLDSYDDLPYESVPIPDTHPDYLGALARLFGVDAAPAAACRVLELGCAAGGNLIPMAWYLPESQFVGVDLGRRHVEAANALIAELGLGNVQVLHRSVDDDLSDLGEFDYIIAHGLFSWVPRPVQDALLAVCARQLAPQGVAYVSYNTLPGWHARAGLREMLLAYCDASAPASTRLTQAQALFDLLEPALRVQDSHEARALLAEIDYLRRAPASYVYHEYLEADNEPIWFADFMARAQAAGLDYLGDAGLDTMLPATLGEATAKALAGLTDRLRLEQLMDYARLRKFRRTLLVRRGTPVRNVPDMSAFEGLAFHADLACAEELDLASTEPQTFTLPAGGRYQVRHPLGKAALMLLAMRYPDGLGWAELSAGAIELVREHGTADLAQETDALRLELFSLAAYQGVRLSGAPCRLARHELPQRPTAHALARAQARAGAILASVRHTPVELDPYGARLVAGLDGTRDLEALTDWLLEALEADGHGHLARAPVQEACEAVLWTLARGGLLA